VEKKKEEKIQDNTQQGNRNDAGINQKCVYPAQKGNRVCQKIDFSKRQKADFRKEILTLWHQN